MIVVRYLLLTDTVCVHYSRLSIFSRSSIIHFENSEQTAATRHHSKQSAITAQMSLISKDY